MTLAIFLSAFVLLVVVAASVVVRSDRKRGVGNGHGAAVADATVSIPVVGSLTVDQAKVVAIEAVRGIGGRHAQVVDGQIVVGWIGNAFTNVPKWAEYRLSIVISGDPDGLVHLLCGAAPRFSTSLGGHRRCQDLAQLLAAEVGRRIV